MQQNKTPTSHGTRDLLDLVKKEVMLALNCHAIAKVTSYDSANQTLSATMQYDQTYNKLNSTGQVVSTNVPYPVLLDCPVIIIGGGGAGLSFPIAVGDECLILFNDRDLDNWFAGQSSGSPASNRLHSFSDGMALVWNTSNPGYDAARAVLYNGTTGVGVSSSKVKVYNNSTTLNTVLQSLVTHLKNLTTSNAVVGSPCTLSAASIAALAGDATAIQGLLE